MSRNTWQVYVQNSAGTWVLDETIYVPNNENLSMDESSTQNKQQMVDGSFAFITPETKYQKNPIQLNWVEVDQTFMELIRDYFRNGDNLKIVTQVSGREFIGRFIQFTSNWLGGVEDVYDVDVVFEQIDSLDE